MGHPGLEIRAGVVPVATGDSVALATGTDEGVRPYTGPHAGQTCSSLFRVASLFGAGWGKHAVDSVGFIVRASGEKQLVAQATVQVIASETQPPEAADRKRSAGRVQERAYQFSVDRIEGMDQTIAEVADQQAMAERTEIPRRQSNAPGSVQGSMLQSQQEVSGNIEHIHEAKSGTVVLIEGARLAMCECDYDVAAHVLNPERSVIGRQIRIDETSGYWGTVKMPVEDFDFTALKVGGVKAGSGRRGGQRESLVDRFSGTIHFYDRGRRIRAGVPAGNGTVFGGKQEDRRLPGTNFECAGVVVDRPGGCSTRLSIGCWNRNYKRFGQAGEVVQRRQPRAVVGNPPGRARRTRHSPGIYEVRIDVRRSRRDGGVVGGEIGSLVVLRQRVAGSQQ